MKNTIHHKNNNFLNNKKFYNKNSIPMIILYQFEAKDGKIIHQIMFNDSKTSQQWAATSASLQPLQMFNDSGGTTATV